MNNWGPRIFVARLFYELTYPEERAVSEREVLDWLLEGDVSVQYQVVRDLFGREEKQLRERIASEGWGGCP